MAALVMLVWVPFIYGLANPEKNYDADQVAWGGLPDGDQYVSVYVHETKPDRKIIMVALHYNGLGDIKDAQGLQKSEPYDYNAGLQTFIVQPDQAFRNQTAAGVKAVNAMLLDMPNSVAPQQFVTVRQAIALGGKIVLQRSSAGL